MSRKISRTDVNFLLDTVLLLLFVALSISSVILEFVFPVGTEADGWLLWQWSYNEWSRLRFGLLAALALSVLVHVMLHWSWVCGVVASRRGSSHSHRPAARDDPSRTLWGVGLLILIINLAGAIVAAAALMIQAPAIIP